MNEFELNDEIELSDHSGFKKENTHKALFKSQDPDSLYWGIDKEGYMRNGLFARKIEPMVKVWIGELDSNGYPERVFYKIPKALADKIKAGEFE